MMMNNHIYYQISSMSVGGTSFYQWKYSRDQILKCRNMTRFGNLDFPVLVTVFNDRFWWVGILFLETEGGFS